MAAASLLSRLAVPNPEAVGSNIGASKSSFLPSTKLFFSKKPLPRKPVARRCYTPPVAGSLDRIPKQFRGENLKDGLMENYKNAAETLYGLSPKQLELFMTENNPFFREAEDLTGESISAARSYMDDGGMWTVSGVRDYSRYSMSANMYRGRGGGYGRRRGAAPDLPSLILDARIVYLAMPIVPEVTELIVSEFMWLDYDDPTKPIYLYINSSGTQNERMEIVGSETDAFAIVDAMLLCKSAIYTVNCAMAFGQAAMLLSLGKKGFRALQPNSTTKLHLPKVHQSSGSAIDMWIKSEELNSNTDYFLNLLEAGVGKPKEELRNDLQVPRYFDAEGAIEYGIADRILQPEEEAFEKRNYDKILAESKAKKKGARSSPQATPSGF